MTAIKPQDDPAEGARDVVERELDRQQDGPASGQGAPAGNQPLQDKAVAAVIEELERQAAENPQLRVRRNGETVTVEGDIDIDPIVMVVVGSMAGGP